MKNRAIIFAFLAFSLLMQYANAKHKLEEREKVYGTDGTGSIDLSVFHWIAEQEGGLSLRFPGYIIAVEKANPKNIGFNDVEEIFYEEKIRENIKYVESINRILNRTNGSLSPDRIKSTIESLKLKLMSDKKELDDLVPEMSEYSFNKRTFLSHIVKYSIKNDKNNFPCITEDFIFNAYDKDTNHQGVYIQGLKTLGKLKTDISKMVEYEYKNQTPYTHIFLYCMGWNTDQQESIRNYNSFMWQLVNAYKGDTSFKPLFIGITWPSLWKSSVAGAVVAGVSYFCKKDDADEVGLIWVNKILHDVLVPIKKERNIPLILVGHSFGVRVITRAVFSHGLVDLREKDANNANKNANNSPILSVSSDPGDIDLVIGLQGAVSIDRFIKNQGDEGFPYSDFKNYARKFVFTWSESDSANPKAKMFGENHVGGKPGFNKSKGYPAIFDQFKIQANNSDGGWDLTFDKVSENNIWKNSFNNQGKISIVDASALIKYEPYGKGGNAHSDVYTPGVAQFVWDCIKNIEHVNENSTK